MGSICGVRENEGGTLYTHSYGRTVTANIDPIEKKPLYHFMPGSLILSIGPNGCTLDCDNCQNWSISQAEAPTTYIAPEDLVVLAAVRVGTTRLIDNLLIEFR